MHHRVVRWPISGQYLYIYISFLGSTWANDVFNDVMWHLLNASVLSKLIRLKPTSFTSSNWKVHIRFLLNLYATSFDSPCLVIGSQPPATFYSYMFWIHNTLVYGPYVSALYWHIWKVQHSPFLLCCSIATNVQLELIGSL